MASRRVECVIEHDVPMVNDNGTTVMGVRATCVRCDHTTESYGSSGKSVRRCLVHMREECPMGEENFYYSDDGTDND